MLTKGQKIYMYLCAILSMIIAIVTFIPFRTLPFMCNVSTIRVNSVVTAEMIIKLIVFPVVLIALSVFANVKKYQEIQDGLDRSKVVIVMSYFPIISYLIAIITYVVHTLSYSYEPLGFSVWAVVMVLLVIYLFFVGIVSNFLSKIVIKFDLVGTVIFDTVLFLVVFCFGLVTWRSTLTYLDFFAATKDYVGHGDGLLFFIYVAALVSFIALCPTLLKLFKKDNRSIYVNPEMFEKNYDKIVKNEYARAYNDILDDFELYFSEHLADELDTQEEKEETITEEPVSEEKEETMTEEPVSEEKEETMTEEPVSEEKEETTAEEK